MAIRALLAVTTLLPALNASIIIDFAIVSPPISSTTIFISGSSNKHIFKYQEQAESMIAYAQLTQLMALPCFNGDWKPSWDSKDLKYCIHSYGKQQLIIIHSYKIQQFLAFKSEEKAKIFLELYKDLIDIFFQNV